MVFCRGPKVELTLNSVSYKLDSAFNQGPWEPSCKAISTLLLLQALHIKSLRPHVMMNRKQIDVFASMSVSGWFQRWGIF